MMSSDEVIPEEDAMSFKGRMNRDFYNRVNPELVMPESQRHFPEPGREEEYDKMIEDFNNDFATYVAETLAFQKSIKEQLEGLSVNEKE